MGGAPRWLGVEMRHFAALKEVKFRGWAVIELDSVPDKSKTPRECALISKKYVEEKLGMKI